MNLKALARGILEREAVMRNSAQEAEIDGLARANGWKPLSRPGYPAWRIIEICHAHGVGLRIEPDGTVVIESYGRAWHALIEAIAAHVDEIASILLTTGDGKQFSVRRCDA
jgi:hypothetical protein